MTTPAQPDLLLEMIGALPDPVFILTETGRYLGVAGGKDADNYHDGSSLVGLRLSDVMTREKADWFIAQIHTSLREEKLHIVEYSLSQTDVKGLENSSGPSGELWFEGRLQPLSKSYDGERAVVWVARNITSRHQLEDELRRISETDPLTEIANRRKFLKGLNEFYTEYRRYQHPASLLMLDIDHFKNINDSFGHLAGDQVLCQISRICEDRLRKVDLFCRFGGEEFAVLLPHTEAASARSMAERLRKAIADHVYEFSYDGLKVTVSIGISEIHPEDSSIDEVIKRADASLYQAKHQGRNCCVIY